MDTTPRARASVTTAGATRFAATLAAGVGAAIVGAVVMALVLIVAFMAIERTSVVYALRPIGTLLYGDRMLVAPTAAMYAGAAALHFGVAIAWGIVWACMASLLRVEVSPPGALLVGVVVGLAALIVDVQVIAPAIGNARWGDDLFTSTMPPAFSWLAHVAFGASFVIAPRFYRRAALAAT
jgi:hypothetical protein